MFELQKLTKMGVWERLFDILFPLACAKSIEWYIDQVAIEK